MLGQELRGARKSTLETVRKQIGFIFQSHNLIEALSSLQNVEMALLMKSDLSRRQAQERARAMLEAVGLTHRMHEHPSRLSGGQGGSGWRYRDTTELGLSVRYGLTPNLSLDGTLNPDFSRATCRTVLPSLCAVFAISAALS